MWICFVEGEVKIVFDMVVDKRLVLMKLEKEGLWFVLLFEMRWMCWEEDLEEGWR